MKPWFLRGNVNNVLQTASECLVRERCHSCSVMSTRYLDRLPVRAGSLGLISDVVGRKNVVHVLVEDNAEPEATETTSTESMQPVLYHFKLLGLWKTQPVEAALESKKPWKNSSARCWVTVAILSVLMVFKVSTSVAICIAGGVKTVPGTISDVFELVVGVGTTWHLLRNQTRMTKSFQANWRMVRPFSRSRIVALKRKAIFLVILAWIYFIILSAQAVVVVYATPADMMRYFYGKYFQNSPIAIGYVLRTLRGIGYSVVRFICVLNVTLFIVLCLQVKGTMAQLLERFGESVNLEQINSSHVVELMELWDSFARMVRDMDATYSAVVFLWYGDLLHRVVHYFPSSIDLLGEGYTYDGCVIGILAVFYSFLFASMTMSASAIADGGDEALHLVRKMSCKLSQMDPYVYQNAVILMTTLGYRNVYLTGWDCFVIRKFIILTVVGLVFTYIVLINQILQN